MQFTMLTVNGASMINRMIRRDIIEKAYQGTKLTFLARSHLAPKFSKVLAKAKKLGAIKKKR